jgi:hypothetical protein
MKGMREVPIFHDIESLTSSIEKQYNTKRNPWIHPTQVTIIGIFAKYFRGIAKNNKTR